MRISDWSSDVCSSDLREVTVIGDADRNAQSDVPVGIGPVLHLLRHQVLVRDQMLLAVPCDDGHGAHTDLVDCASAAADHDDIAGLDRSVHQQNDPGDEISECLLQTKADGQTGRARENRKCGQIDTSYVDADNRYEEQTSELQ